MFAVDKKIQNMMGTLKIMPSQITHVDSNLMHLTLLGKTLYPKKINFNTPQQDCQASHTPGTHHYSCIRHTRAFEHIALKNFNNKIAFGYFPKH